MGDERPDGTKNARGARAKNWWYYHWKPVLLALILAAAGAVCAAQFFGQKEPDLRVGYAATQELPPETAAALTEALEGFCTDRDGDGQVTVELEQFTVDLRQGAAPVDMNAQMAGVTLLTGFIYDAGGANLFFLQDPEGFQRRTGALRYLDGTVPAEENAYDAENWRQMVYAWTDCPVLAGLDLGSQELPEGLYIGRCAPGSRAEADYAAAIDDLWQALTAGAAPPAGE